MTSLGVDRCLGEVGDEKGSGTRSETEVHTPFLYSVFNVVATDYFHQHVCVFLLVGWFVIFHTFLFFVFVLFCFLSKLLFLHGSSLIAVLWSHTYLQTNNVIYIIWKVFVYAPPLLPSPSPTPPSPSPHTLTLLCAVWDLAQGYAY